MGCFVKSETGGCHHVAFIVARLDFWWLGQLYMSTTYKLPNPASSSPLLPPFCYRRAMPDPTRRVASFSSLQGQKFHPRLLRLSRPIWDSLIGILDMTRNPETPPPTSSSSSSSSSSGSKQAAQELFWNSGEGKRRRSAGGGGVISSSDYECDHKSYGKRVIDIEGSTNESNSGRKGGRGRGSGGKRGKGVGVEVQVGAMV